MSAPAAATTTQISEDRQAFYDSIQRPAPDERVKTEDVINSRNLSFEDFNLKDGVLRAIYEAGYENPSPVQAESIPFALLRRNILARAKNGTGKTASYVIPVIESIDTSVRRVQAVILIPMRELATQVANTVETLARHVGVNRVALMGGTSTADDVLRLRNPDVPPHVVVSTPSRLKDLAERIPGLLSHVHTVVLDEADKLLSDDFRPPVEWVLNATKEGRQIMLFSATYPAEVQQFQEQWLGDKCEVINLMEELTLKGITQFYAYLQESQKVHCLATLFSKLSINQAMIFCNSVKRVELLAKKITEMGASCYFIHARMTQQERNKVFHNFRQGNARNLVATDLLSRGFDVQAVNVVINFDFPKSAETYLHRIGRSGRFGHLGIAINLITPDDRLALYRIEQELSTEITAVPAEIDTKLYCV